MIFLRKSKKIFQKNAVKTECMAFFLFFVFYFFFKTLFKAVKQLFSKKKSLKKVAWRFFPIFLDEKKNFEKKNGK